MLEMKNTYQQSGQYYKVFDLSVLDTIEKYIWIIIKNIVFKHL